MIDTSNMSEREELLKDIEKMAKEQGIVLEKYDVVHADGTKNNIVVVASEKEFFIEKYLEDHPGSTFTLHKD